MPHWEICAASASPWFPVGEFGDRGRQVGHRRDDEVGAGFREPRSQILGHVTGTYETNARHACGAGRRDAER